MPRWQLIRTEEGVVLSRPGRMRLDVGARSGFPPLRPAALAHEIRKDLWRMLQRLRGFSPVVVIRRDAAGLEVEAGGEMAAGMPLPPGVAERIAGMLADPHRRARWIAHARLR
ncbi:hypothetical protein [Mangrovicoccus algicola]|uniref:Uncharacterized protein n=1 Tax=Mangrovicoccus algicola TaxID=2771008 RepID=A0A8J6YR35_9RHOB|nr:hypothetical protein [Mangrovicoccus algicola]MBE3638043.1 hypothetical protein [Mangrovicoccus algicola]